MYAAAKINMSIKNKIEAGLEKITINPLMKITGRSIT